ncbi:hypothetical protein [Nonomuraea sp. NPDC049607]
MTPIRTELVRQVTTVSDPPRRARFATGLNTRGIARPDTRLIPEPGA